MTRDTILNVGFDDTDSPVGMCTTYLAYLIADSLRSSSYGNNSNSNSNNPTPSSSAQRGKLGSSKTTASDAAPASKDAPALEFVDYPCLVRFNPNVPWKTRGNGAVSMRIRTDSPRRVKDEIISAVFEHADIPNGANPGLVFLEGDTIPGTVAEFSRLALWQLIGRADARRFAAANNLEHHYRGNGQGLVGAIGAIGYDWAGSDSTMELLCYRNPSMCGTKREVSAESVRRMQAETFPGTFSSFDERRGRVLITPRGPDPVFYGIRGEDAASLVAASGMVRSGETPKGYMIFRTNQGTGAHLEHELTPDTARPFASGWVHGTVTGSPMMERGGHVFFEIAAVPAAVAATTTTTNVPPNPVTSSDTAGPPAPCGTPHRIRCAVYKPTGITRIARSLMEGDTLRVGGGVRKASKTHERVLNVEYIRIIDLADDARLGNPACPACGKSMKSKGVGQGYECAKCKDQRASSRIVRRMPRSIQRGLYIPDVSAHRHLTRPVQRQNRRNRVAPFDASSPWLGVFSGSSGE